MTLLRRLTMALLIAEALAAPANAQAHWTVAAVASPVQWAPDGRAWRELRPGMQLPDGAWIQVGRTGRVILRRSNHMIQLKPNTVASVSSRAEDGGRGATILQKLGTILFEVAPGPEGGTTAVQTPFLALIVKGTRFEVTVSRRGATTRVEQGVVQATAPVRGERTDVRAGQRVHVDASGERPMVVHGFGQKQRLVLVKPGPARLRPARSARRAGGFADPAASNEDRPRGWPRIALDEPEEGPPTTGEDDDDDGKDNGEDDDDHGKDNGNDGNVGGNDNGANGDGNGRGGEGNGSTPAPTERRRRA